MLVKDGLKIVGLGHYVPPKVVTNDDMSKIVDTNDEWITSRTGIKKRHFAEPNVKNQELAKKSVEAAILDAGIDKKDIGALIVATILEDNLTPSIACMIQSELELPEEIPCLDINAACSGFMYGLQVARGLLLQSNKRYAVVVGSEILSRVMDMTDRSSCVLFGDGSGAAVIELADNKFISSLGSKGNDVALVCPNNSTENRFVSMVGGDVFKFAVATVSKTVLQLMEDAGVTADEIDYFVMHQANYRIIETVAKKCKQSIDKFYINLNEYANTSSASIPIALSEMKQKGLLKEGMKIISVGFGGGLTWGGAYIEF